MPASTKVVYVNGVRGFADEDDPHLFHVARQPTHSALMSEAPRMGSDAVSEWQRTITHHHHHKAENRTSDPAAPAAHAVDWNASVKAHVADLLGTDTPALHEAKIHVRVLHTGREKG